MKKSSKEMKFGRSSVISSCHFSFFNTPKPPIQAMEFLSRSWSPSSSDFFQILSSPSTSSPFPSPSSSLSDMLLQTDDEEGDWTVSAGNSSRRAKRKNTVCMQGLNLDLKTWLGVSFGVGDFMSEFSRGSNKQKRERSRRHSALTVTQLAASVAGVMGNMQMGEAVTSASVLVATVCAETAESSGVDRIHITSAMNMGFDIPSTSAPTRSCSVEQQEILARGTQLLVLNSSRKAHKMEVSVHIKRSIRLVLRLGKKFLLGAITRHKEHEIVRVNEEEDMIGDGSFVTKVGTAGGGAFNILFDNRMQCNAWKSFISDFLFSQTSGNPA
ncbi:hypothetical protein ZOSMA_31G00940 [Zostera marina]|uniref:Pleckstrin-like plant domain-containing protein n=1 Tax=Zostera marina TaxID=29655 RepID=A0A0K9P929_ZOSMR|nr:hypothetical protein ZOSMA_31G00940 [Zostera marina]